MHLFTERAVEHISVLQARLFDTDGRRSPFATEVDGITARVWSWRQPNWHRISVFDLAQRLDDQLNLLSSNDPNISPHLRSVRSSIDRSYETLSEDQKMLLCYLSVFVGTWSLIDVERIAPALGIPRSAIDEALGELVDKNLVQIDRRNDRYRYQTPSIDQPVRIREAGPGRQWGPRSGEQSSCRCISTRIGGSQLIRRPDQGIRVDSTYPNFKVALQYLAHRPGRAPDGLRLATSLRDYWPTRVKDGTALFRSLLNEASDIPDGSCRGLPCVRRAAVHGRRPFGVRRL